MIYRRALIGHDVHFVTTAGEAIQRLEIEEWDVVSLDHDLNGQAYVPSGPGTGYEVACWLEGRPERRPRRILVHSLNDPGRKRITAALPEAVECPGVWMDPERLKELLTPPPCEDVPAS